MQLPIRENTILFLETRPAKANNATLEIVKEMASHAHVVVLSVNRPYENLMQTYQENGVNTENVFVIDCISASQGAAATGKNVVFIEDANELTEIAIAIDEHMESFVCIDSITTMLLYNKPDVFTRFLHSVLTKMRINHIGGVFTSLVDEGSKEIRAEIAQLCDEVFTYE